MPTIPTTSIVKPVSSRTSPIAVSAMLSPRSMVVEVGLLLVKEEGSVSEDVDRTLCSSEHLGPEHRRDVGALREERDQLGLARVS